MHPDPGLPNTTTQRETNAHERTMPEIVWSIKKRLTEHFPRSNRAVEILKNCSRGWTECASALLQDNLGVKHRPKGLLVRRRGANTGNAKVPKVHAELASLDIRTMLPMNAVRHDPLPGACEGTYLSRAARRVFSNEKDCSGAKVFSDRTLLRLAW